MVWAVAALLWTITVVAELFLGDHPIQGPRAAVFALASVGAGALITLAMLAVRWWPDIVVTLLLILASDAGRGYLDSDQPATTAHAVIAGVGAVVAVVVCRAIAGRLPPRECDVAAN